MALLVMKFGGTSVGNAGCIRRAAQIVCKRAASDGVVVVVSAMAKVTDQIVAALHAAKSGSLHEVSATCEGLRARHRAVVDELFPAGLRAEIYAEIDSSIQRLLEIGSGMAQLRASAPQIADMALALGEEMSAKVFARQVQQGGVAAEYVDSARVLVTDGKFGDATPDVDATRLRAAETLLPAIQRGCVPIVTGYRGVTASGQLTTLGRGGSDFSATALGAAINADEIWIWTDVDGVLTADPRICPAAATLSDITFAEAVELSHYGAKVIHERAVQPARAAGIPVWIKNSFRPEIPGTRISNRSVSNGSPVKAVTAVTRASLITVTTRQEGHLNEIVGRLMMRLAASHVDLLFSTQSSQNAFGLLIREQDDHHVVESIRRLFHTELRHGVLDPVNIERNIAVVAVLGEAMKGRPGILARLFAAVATRNVSVIAVAQGASELSICFAVPAQAAADVVQAVHHEFYNEAEGRPMRTLNGAAASVVV